MSALEHAPFRGLSEVQLSVLRSLEVDIYVRRDRAAATPAASVVAGLPWSEADLATALARAIARAAGSIDAVGWLSGWVAAGLTAPALAQLRQGADGKRALWRQMRARLDRS
jgi:hypothetical protein